MRSAEWSGEIGRFRGRHLTPIPHVGSLEALNAALAAADARDDAAASTAGPKPSARRAARELPLLRRLLAEWTDPHQPTAKPR